MDCTTAVLSLVDFARDTLESVAGFDVSGVRTAVRGSRSHSFDPTAARVIGEREPLFATPDPVAADSARSWLRPPRSTAAGWRFPCCCRERASA